MSNSTDPYLGSFVARINMLMWPTTYAEQEPLDPVEMDRQRAIEQKIYLANLERSGGTHWP